MSNRGRITRAAVLTVLTAVLGLSLAGCKHTTTENLTSTIAIVNDCGADIDVYMDGALKTTVAAATQGAITDVAAGSRLLEAKLKGTSDLVLSETKTITAGTTVSFTVTGQAVLRITNNFTEILKIYTNATYTGDIGPGLTQSIGRVKFGTYNLLAVLRSDSSEAASTTIAVTAVQTYDWVINP